MKFQNQNKLYIVMYHYIRDVQNSRYPKIKGLDTELFRQQLKFFKSRFHVVRMEEVIMASKGEGELPENAVLLTFDDGYMDHYTVAMPLLEDEGMQGSFFVPGKILTTHELLDVNKIHYILAAAPIKQLLLDVMERLDYYRGAEYDYPSNAELFDAYAIANRWDSKETIFVKRVLQNAIPEAIRNRIAGDLINRYIGGGGTWQASCILTLTRCAA